MSTSLLRVEFWHFLIIVLVLVLDKSTLQTQKDGSRAMGGKKGVMLFASLIMMLCLRTVMYCADTQSDVMFAHYAVRRNITYVVNIIAEGNITCPQGQTSFGAAAGLRT